MFLLTDTGYLSDKVSEKLIWQQFHNDWIIPVTWPNFNLFRKKHKLFLGNQVANVVEITLYLVNPVSSLSRFYVYIYVLSSRPLEYIEDSWKYSFRKLSEKTILTKVWWSLYNTSDITKFQTLFRIQSIPTLSRVLFYRGIDESRDRFKHLMESEPRGKVGSFCDNTRITWLQGRHISEARKCKRFTQYVTIKKLYVFLSGC